MLTNYKKVRFDSVAVGQCFTVTLNNVVVFIKEEEGASVLIDGVSENKPYKFFNDHIVFITNN